MAGWKALVDGSIAAAAIAAPFLTIGGWVYASRNERRLDLVIDARKSDLSLLGEYLDYVRALRMALERLSDTPDDPQARGSIANLLEAESDSWIQLVQVRDSESVFPQARPIREALVQNHPLVLIPACREAAECRRRGELVRAIAMASEFESGVLALRVAISNSATRALFVRHLYALADTRSTFGVVSVPARQYYASLSRFGRIVEWARPQPPRSRVWLLSGQSECPELWDYDSDTRLAVEYFTRRRLLNWRALTRPEVPQPLGVRRLSALAS